MPSRLIASTGLLLLFCSVVCAQNACVSFPANLIPLSSVNYVTAANAKGDQLVVGTLSNGLNTLAPLPSPTSTDQLFCKDPEIQLAPQQFFPAVYVPTTQERSGNFSAFAGLLVDPLTNQPFPNGVIPANRLGSIYAFRIGPVQTLSARNWSLTGALAAAEAAHTMITLPSGKVLVVGLDYELFDPATGIFRVLKNGSSTHGIGATATLLKNGKVLIVGGSTPNPSAELYDPTTETFVPTGPLAVKRLGHTATLLTDGRVLIAGGSTSTASDLLRPLTATAELYDPAAGTFTSIGPLTTARSAHSAVLLKDGRVLIAGGDNVTASSAELFDPQTLKFTRTGAMTCNSLFGSAIPLPSGKVLFFTCFTVPQVDIYDPSSGTFSVDGNLLQLNALKTVTLLTNGQVLLAGGIVQSGSIATETRSTQLYNPATHVATPTADMNVARYYHAAALLQDGHVLVSGGQPVNGQLYTSAEIYTPTVQGLFTSQTGLTIRAPQSASTIPSQSVSVLSLTDTIPYTVSVSTFTGGPWLKAAPSSGSAGPIASATLTVSADPTGLAPTDYYGTVTLTPTDGIHPPISLTVVLSLVKAGAASAPVVTPGGLVFLSSKPQTFTISNLTSSPLSFTATATQSTNFFDFSPKTGAIGAALSQTITVTPSASALTAGVSRGSIQIKFGDGSSQTVDVLLVAGATATSASPFERGATACTATKLLPVMTSVSAGFSAAAAWPTPIVVQVVDDCGTQINSGFVSASFTNGDAPIALLPVGAGSWSATPSARATPPARPSAPTPNPARSSDRSPSRVKSRPTPKFPSSRKVASSVPAII